MISEETETISGEKVLSRSEEVLPESVFHSTGGLILLTGIWSCCSSSSIVSFGDPTSCFSRWIPSSSSS